MLILTFAFILSLLSTIFLVRFRHLHEKISADDDLIGVQKFHAIPVPRIGGISVVIGLCGALLLRYYQNQDVGAFGLVLLLCALPAFGFGLLEDLTKRIGVRLRLAATLASAGLAGILFGAWLSNVQMPGIDILMISFPLFAVLLTCFGVAGVANAFNIIDGYNGLSGMVAVIILGGIGYVSFQLNDYEIMTAALAMMGAIIGFLLFNYPRGLIFLGDGGAYLIGFWVAELSVLLTVRHPIVSKWFPLLLCAYPIVETLFSIYRRVFIHRTHPGMPDSSHLHQIIYKRVVRWAVGSADPGNMTVRNSLTAPYLWVLTATAVIPAVLFWDNVWALRIFVFLFIFIYIFCYRKIVQFRVPKWIMVNGGR